MFFNVLKDITAREAYIFCITRTNALIEGLKPNLNRLSNAAFANLSTTNMALRIELFRALFNRRKAFLKVHSKSFRTLKGFHR